ncbi:MAG: tRNA lysidine(34) synthetase TilS [Oscillospiraceae bacterium]|nr:tRNA lysidine(34) synthetase TilS [Oscillospiraceae bacterium]
MTEFTDGIGLRGELAATVGMTVRHHRMLERGDTVLAAVSGGADSVALLHWLCANCERLGVTLVALHVNHGLRGDEAARDEAFVRRLCEEWGVPLRVYAADVRAYAEDHKMGLEEAGRAVRYAFFEEQAALHDRAKIATAHTRSDSTETVLMHLIRGCGLNGLSGIPPVRGNVIRPLIDCTREDVEAYLARHSVAYMTDSTNAHTIFVRNRLRREVLPVLRELNPQLDAAVARLSAHAARDSAYLEELAREADGEIRGQAWGRTAADVKPPVNEPGEREKTSASNPVKTFMPSCANLPATPLAAWPPAIRVRLLRCRARQQSSSQGGQLTISPVPAPKVLEIAEMPFAQYEKIYKKLVNNVLDHDKLQGYLRRRTRRPGDAFRPVGRGTKTLKKLFNEAHIPLNERADVPVFEDGGGIVFVCGFGCDERVKITKDTRTVTVIREKADTAPAIPPQPIAAHHDKQQEGTAG